VVAGGEFHATGDHLFRSQGDLDESNQAWPRIERQQISDGKDIDELKRNYDDLKEDVSDLQEDRSFNAGNGGFPGRKARSPEKDGIPRAPVEAPEPPSKPQPAPRDKGPGDKGPGDDEIIEIEE
jgi:hypothetical protein